jgi:hypothetical protein
MTRARALLASTGAAAAAALGAPGGAAALTDEVSQNWAGYAVNGPRFQRVSGYWTVPKVRCSPGPKRWSGAWVGLGGFSASSQALEQVGTDHNCGSKGKSHYSAWWELVPADPVTIKIEVQPGDKVSASVSVSGRSVTLRFRNRTRDKSFATTRQMSSPAPDITSAEWIVEAPAACDDVGNCDVLPLADFGSVPLSNVLAKTLSGTERPLGRGPWSGTRMRMSDPAGGGASTSGIGSDRASFKVTYLAEGRSTRLSKASRIVGPAARHR